MHSDDSLRSLGSFSDLTDGNGGGVGCEYAVFRNDFLHRLQDSVLHSNFLKDRWKVEKG